MPHRKKLYSLMAQKEKVALGKTANQFRGLAQEHSNATEQGKKIKELMSEKQEALQNSTTKYQLQTSHLFTSQLSDQLEITQNKSEILQRQMGRVKQTMAQQEHKFSRLCEHRDDAAKAEKNNSDS